MSSKSYFEHPDDSLQESKFARKAKDSPFMIIGIGGFLVAGLVGAYKYKNRGTMSTSVFLMQLRVIAQGTVVAALTSGIAYTMYKEHILNKRTKEEALKN